MPIAPKYTWWETLEEVCIRLEGAPIKYQSQVFCSDAVVKVNAAPYFLLLDLHGEVDEDRSAAALHGGSTVLKLQKRGAGTWGRLTAQGDKAALQQRREASIQRAHAKAEAVRQERQARKQRESKAASERQTALERRKRSEIEARKAAELQQERSQLDSWQQSLKAGEQKQQKQQQQLPEGGWLLGTGLAAGEGDESDYEDSDEGADDQGATARDQGLASSSPSQQQQQAGAGAGADDHEHYYGRGWRPAASNAQAAGQRSDGASVASSSDGERSEAGESSEEEEAAARGDGPRHGAQAVEQAAVPVRAAMAAVKVSFTTTESPYLPARETREDEIKEYKRKNGLSGQQDSTDVSERQPAFLKDKGDALYSQHNYRGAMNAYSRALELDESLAAVWANRAACHLQLSQHSHCMHDCDTALALLRPRLEAVETGAAADEDGKLRRLLVKVLARSAAAHSGAGNMQAAAEDLQEALRYDPSNAALAADLSEVMASCAPADADALRARGDARFKAGDHAGAAQAYSLLLALPQGPLGVSEAARLAALANRAACWLPLQRYGDCVADCGAALAGQVAAAAAGLTGRLNTAPAEPVGEEAGAASVDTAGPAAPGSHVPSAAACERTDERMATGVATLDAAECAQGPAGLNSDSPSDIASSIEAAPEAWLAAHAAALEAAGLGPHLASAARLLARRAAARSYLKQYAAAAGDYGLAQQVFGVLEDVARCEQLGRDLQGVLQLQQQAHQR